MLTQERLKELLSYNPETGGFTWLVRKRNDSLKGKAAGHDRKHYSVIVIDGVCYHSHRLAWLYMNGDDGVECVDHINGDSFDNRFVNLRACTNNQNQQNRGKPRTNTSGVKGVSWCKRRKKWKAAVKKDKRYYWCGLFDDIKEAETEVKKLREKLHGEFANHG